MTPRLRQRELALSGMEGAEAKNKLKPGRSGGCARNGHPAPLVSPTLDRRRPANVQEALACGLLR